jgi:uncharacterized paraquat-inducible protein A
MVPSLKNLRLSRFSAIGLIVVGVALLLWLILTVSGVFDAPTKVGMKQKDAKRCPECNMPLTAVAKAKGECLFCHANLGTGENTSTLSGKTVAIVLASLFGVLLVVNTVFFVRSQLRKRRGAEEPQVHLCHKCTRKIRYRTHQAGQFARCPKCHSLIRFPAPPPPSRPWWQLWKKKQQQAV